MVKTKKVKVVKQKDIEEPEYVEVADDSVQEPSIPELDQFLTEFAGNDYTVKVYKLSKDNTTWENCKKYPLDQFDPDLVAEEFGGGKYKIKIIAPDGTNGTATDGERRNESLAVTIARAHRWQQLLESGRYATVGELARDAGVDNSYLARMLRLTVLAPDLVGAILDGTEPDGLSLEKLYRMPVVWNEQRRRLA